MKDGFVEHLIVEIEDAEQEILQDVLNGSNEVECLSAIGARYDLIFKK